MADHKQNEPIFEDSGAFFAVDKRILAEAEKNAREGKLLDLKSDVTFKSFFSKDSKESAYCRRRML